MCALSVYEYALLCRDVYEGDWDTKIPTDPALKVGWRIIDRNTYIPDPSGAESLQQMAALQNQYLNKYPPVIEQTKKYKKDHPLSRSFFARTYQHVISKECVVVFPHHYP